MKEKAFPPGFSRMTLFKSTLVVFAALFLTLGCEKKEDAPKAPVVRPVKVMTVAGSQGHAPLTYPGKTRANQRVDLAFQVPGPLVELPVEEGQAVKKGDLIARIMPRDFQISLDQAKARAINAERQYERYKELYVRRQVSKASFDQYKAERDVAAAQLADARNALKDTYLRAPFDGIVARRYVENFQEVQAKEPIVFFQDNSKIEVLVDAPETVVVNLREDRNMEAHAVFAAAPGREFPLTIKEFSTEADPQTQTYQVVLVMDQPDDINILPGMTATVTGRAPTGSSPEKIVIPAVCVLEDAKGSSYVWLMDKEKMTVHKQLVKTGQMTGSESIIILDGLSGGETLVTSGVTQLSENMNVRIWKP